MRPVPHYGLANANANHFSPIISKRTPSVRVGDLGFRSVAGRWQFGWDRLYLCVLTAPLLT
jgi:hypothetical protein